MKSALTRTIIVCVALNLLTAGFALAQEGNREVSKEVSIAADVAQKQADVAQKQMEVELKQIEDAQKQVILDDLLAAEDLLTAVNRVSIPLLGRIPLLGHGVGGAVLVIPAAEMKIEYLAVITEDMSVMSRIFDKKLEQTHLVPVRGGFFGYLSGGGDVFSQFPARDSRATEAIYLEGYGALFLMKVNVLLSPPPETQQEKETEEEDTDPLWTETIQEMYAPPEVNRRRRTDRPEEKYDAEKVEDLKETLIKTLKHAANIRALKPDESVILTVIGKAGQSAGVTIKAINRRGEYLILDKDKRTTSIVKAPSLSDIGFSSPAVLTIRAKKSDIDAFAKGQLGFDQFRQKTQLISYSYLGENVGGPSRYSPTDMLYGGSRRRTNQTSRF